MIILLRHDATPAQVAELAGRIRGLGLETVPLDDAKGRAIEVLGDERGLVLSLAHDPGVLEILTRRHPLAGGEPLWPHFALRVGILAVGVVAALLLLAGFLPPALSDAASRPLAARPPVEWYLRMPTRVLEAFPASLRSVGGALVLAFGLVVLFLPWIDRFDPGTPKGRAVSRAVRAAGAVMLLVTVVLALGVLS